MGSNDEACLFVFLSLVQLLDARYPDSTVREYAVNLVMEISDSELAELLLQFAQVFFFECFFFHLKKVHDRFDLNGSFSLSLSAFEN